MRHRGWVGAVLVGGLLMAGVVAWLFTGFPHDSQANAPPPRPVSSSGPAAVRPTVPSPPAESRSIRGTVRNARGPVSGAVVLASQAMAGEPLSERVCADDLMHVPDGSLIECSSSERMLELVTQREGEVPVLARGTSLADGSFSLEGLSEGAYTLWVESPEGVGLRRDVVAGQDGVDLMLGGGSRLSGRVTDARREPLAGVLVTAVFTGHSRFFEALTDARGRYDLGPLPRGDYFVAASHQGLMPESTTLRLHLPDVEQAFSLYSPMRVSGHVMSKTGEPVVGTEVRLDKPERTVRTDERGRFSFDGLSVHQTYALTATQEGFMAREEISFAMSGQDLATVPPDVTGIELWLGEPFAEVAGWVRDEQGQPVANAVVSLHSGRGCVSKHFQVNADARGQYHLGPLPSRKYSFRVSSPEGRLAHSSSRELSEGRNTVDFTLQRRLLAEGTLVDERGLPVAGESVSLFETSNEQWITTETSGPDGRFSLDASRRLEPCIDPTVCVPQEERPPGSYLLVVGSGWSEGHRERDHSEQVRVPSSELRLRVARPPTVEGEVVDETGQPVPRADVGLWSVDAPGREVEFASGRTDSRGRFSLVAPHPGRYRLSAALQHASYSQLATQEVELDAAGAQARLRFEAGHPLGGIVVDRTGAPVEGATVAFHSQLWSIVHLEDTHAEATTGPDGRFAFSYVSGEAGALSVRKEGYQMAEPWREDAPEQMRLDPSAREVRVVLARTARLRARFVRADGSPIPRFTVNGEEMDDEEGRFEWPILRTGPLALELSVDGELIPGAAPVRRTLSVRQEVDQDVGTITLRR
ncbi:carboxypeptidase-like regulatory domain-containing protein [Melittangium boletus]|uniref:Carboxypeptidase regulatory-like domain-containing protein n=1 Tax=Melittangium boletus DSM 14713 TaxID=1294270 RepID=A0A250IN60_9BACT|nr:carboxypeptidase-like regulatory domain-containing protein [Melittangium boletus]ATB32708.1 hypothetical protein MEBOL_006197 [Melittangium boletus DSM 14713]